MVIVIINIIAITVYTATFSHSSFRLFAGILGLNRTNPFSGHCCNEETKSKCRSLDKLNTFSKIKYFELYRGKGVWIENYLVGRKKSSFSVPMKECCNASFSPYLVLFTGITGFSDYQRITNDEPRGGTCDVTPTSGEELHTKFSFTCSFWKDEDLPLNYEVFYSRDKDGVSVSAVNGPILKNTQVIFPAGREEFNYTLKISISVKDVYGAWTNTIRDIQVGVSLTTHLRLP